MPLSADLEVWQIRLTNHGDTTKKISIFSAVEFCLWDAHDDATNFQRNFNTGEVEVEDGVIYHKTEYRERRDHFAFFACTPSPVSYETRRDAFLSPYRGWDRPLAVELGELSNGEAHGWSPIGALQVDFSLQPGETRQAIFLLGIHHNPVAEKFEPPGSNRINKTRTPTHHRILPPRL